MSYLPYNKQLRQFSRNLGNNYTLGKIILWKGLRAGKMREFKFNRQKPIGDYIADFYCKKLRLVIEADGLSHCNKRKEDAEKDKYLMELGLKVLRLDEYEIRNDVKHALNEIIKFIEAFCEKEKIPLPDTQGLHTPLFKGDHLQTNFYPGK